jgi:hypothetical protein
MQKEIAKEREREKVRELGGWSTLVFERERKIEERAGEMGKKLRVGFGFRLM